MLGKISLSYGLIFFWISKHRDSNDLSFHVKNFVFSPRLQLVICLLRQGKCAYSISQAEMDWFEIYSDIGNYMRILTHNLIYIYVYEIMCKSTRVVTYKSL